MEPPVVTVTHVIKLAISRSDISSLATRVLTNSLLESPYATL